MRKDRFIDWHLRTVIQSGYLLLALNKLWLIVNQEIR
ncbi:hypothetical protein ACG9H6_19565 [Acinetobacter baumannii]